MERTDTGLRKEAGKKAFIHFISDPDNGSPTTVDLRNTMEDMGVERGTRNLGVLKKDMKEITSDLAAIIQQKEQLGSDGETKLVPDSVFEMTLKFYNEIKADLQKSYDKKLESIEKELAQIKEENKEALKREKVLIKENAKLQGDIETSRGKLTIETASVIDLNKALKAANEEIETQKGHAVELEGDKTQLKAEGDKLKGIFDDQVVALEELYKDSEEKIKNKLQTRDDEIVGFKKKIKTETTKYNKIKAIYDTENLEFQKNKIRLQQSKKLQDTNKDINDKLILMQVELDTKNDLIEKLLLSIQTSKPEKKQETKKKKGVKVSEGKVSHKRDGNKLYYTRAQLKQALSRDLVAALIAKGDCIQFMLKDEREGYLVNAQKAIRRFASEKKAWDLIEQIKGQVND